MTTLLLHVRLELDTVIGRRDVPVGVPLYLSTPTGMSCIGTYGEKLQVKQCVKILCFISCFSTIMALKMMSRKNTLIHN